MRSNGNLKNADCDLLAELIGQSLIAFGSDKPGVDPGCAIERVFLQAQDRIVTVALEFDQADVCGEEGDHLHFEVSRGFGELRAAEAEAGIYYQFRGELIRSIRVHRAVLKRTQEGTDSGKLEYDAAIELLFDSGSLIFIMSDLVVPMIETIIFGPDELVELPDPSSGWPSTILDAWSGSWSSYEIEPSRSSRA